jgi:GyrI-like small molecule binding domain
VALPFGVRQKPALVEMPAQKMAVVRSLGDPGEVAADVFPALFGAVYALKFKVLKPRGVEFKVGAPRARWPLPLETPREEWVGIWGIPVPDDTDELPQTVPDVPVTLETWEYGTTAHILHLGPYADEEPTVARLRAFVAESGYAIAGPHEEEYLTMPDAKNLKTIIRYPVAPA